MPEDWRALYPFESHRLRIGSHELHYLDEGPRDAPAVLLLHGNPTWSFYYRDLIAALRVDHRVVAPDHLGCGLSDKPQDWGYRLAGHVANLGELVEHLGLERLTLGVHDWGGPIGFGFAARRPERVRRLVVFNTAAFRADMMPLRLAVCRLPLVGPLLVRGLNAFARSATFVTTVKPLPPPVRRAYLAPYDSWANRVAVLRFVQDIPTGPAHPSWKALLEIEAALPRFADHPLLLVWGDRDWVFTPALRREWERRFPAAEVHAFADAGHYVIEDAADRIPGLVRAFLARTA